MKPPPTLLLTLALPTGLAAQGKTPLEWMTLKNAEWPAVSPDGGNVAYRLHSPIWEQRRNDAQIWLVSTTTGAQRQLTNGTGPSWAPAWSPDGRMIAYLSAQAQGTQVYLVPAGGGKPVQLTSAPNGVEGFRWSPDGGFIAYVAGELVVQPDSAGVATHAKVFRVLGREPSYSASLWVIPVPAGGTRPATARRLTQPDDLVVDDTFSWSPDGSRLAFSALDRASPQSSSGYDIYLVGLQDQPVRKVVADRGPQYFPLWSPDGRTIAFRTSVRSSREEYKVYSIGFVATVPAEGGAAQLLTPDFDETATPIAWAPDGIYFTARHRTFSHLFRVNPSTRAITRVTEPATAIKTSFSFSRDFRQIAFLSQDSARYQEVYLAPIDGTARPKRLTALGDQLRDWPIGLRELITWTSTDGTPIEGVLVKPRDFDPNRKYPLLVIVHSGPLEVDQLTVSRDFPYPADLYVMRGMLVLRPNYRGSVGYGARFRAALVRNQGVQQYHDVITGVDQLIGMGIVDSTRVGAAGWSAGAYVIAFGSVWSNRFRTVSLLSTATDWRLAYALGGGGRAWLDYTQATPWDDPEFFRSTSVVTYVKRARTPTLLQHGEADQAAPIAGAYELHRALVDQGVTVRMVVFPGMGHVPNSSEQARAILEQNLDWFEHWLLSR